MAIAGEVVGWLVGWLVRVNAPSLDEDLARPNIFERVEIDVRASTGKGASNHRDAVGKAPVRQGVVEHLHHVSAVRHLGGKREGRKGKKEEEKNV